MTAQELADLCHTAGLDTQDGHNALEELRRRADSYSVLRSRICRALGTWSGDWVDAAVGRISARKSVRP